MPGIIKKIINSILDVFLRVCSNIFPTVAIIITYLRKFKRLPNLKNPQTFNEKILNKILYDRDPILTLIADKYLVREFVKTCLGSDKYLTKIYGVVNNPAKIYTLNLPNKFVMKPNHLSGAVKIVYDLKKLKYGELEKLAAIWLKRNYYKVLNEWAYKDIQPCIIFEELLEDEGEIPDDYKFFCFNGEPRFIQIDKSRFIKHQRNIYDLNLLLLPVRLSYENFLQKISTPKNYDKMLEIARKLSSGFDFVRVDLYNLNGRIIFGELTNYPGGGVEKFDPPFWDIKFGTYWKQMSLVGS